MYLLAGPPAQQGYNFQGNTINVAMLKRVFLTNK